MTTDDSAGRDITSHSDVIDRIGTSRLASEIGAKRATVDGWKTRNSIPGRWFIRVASAAERVGMPGVTVCVLARLAEAEAPAVE